MSLHTFTNSTRPNLQNKCKRCLLVQLKTDKDNLKVVLYEKIVPKIEKWISVTHESIYLDANFSTSSATIFFGAISSMYKYLSRARTASLLKSCKSTLLTFSILWKNDRWVRVFPFTCQRFLVKKRITFKWYRETAQNLRVAHTRVKIKYPVLCFLFQHKNKTYSITTACTSTYFHHFPVKLHSDMQCNLVE